MTGMRKLPVALLAVSIAILLAATAAGGHARARPVGVPGRLAVRVPEGWHVIHGWLSDVVDPAPRLAVASFPARLSRHTCACGFPNVIHFPRDGAFVFVWEYLHPSTRMLAALPLRPTTFRLTDAKSQRLTCSGPSDGFNFKDQNRDLQVEAYFGPDATAATKRKLLALLDSLRAARPLG
jgi:hypothetical protein